MAKSKRVSFRVPTLLHDNPTPNATRKGGTIMSSGIFGFIPEVGKKGKEHRFPDTIEAECEQMLQNMRTVVEAAGGTIDDVTYVRVFMPDKTIKKVLNGPWKIMFPDDDSEPTRGVSEETLSYGRVRCEFMAVIDVIAMLG